MKSNYELIKECVDEVNSDINIFVDTKNEDTLIIVSYKDEVLAVSTEDMFEGSSEPIIDVIRDFYSVNERAKSKEYAKSLEKELNKIFKKMLKSDDNEEILSLVVESKKIKSEIDSLKEDLKWTKKIGRLLYLVKETFEEKFNDEVA